MPDIERNSMAGQVTTNLGRVALRPRGEYSSGETYDRLDLVRYDGSGWICLKDNTTSSPEDGENWSLYVEKGDSGNATLAESWTQGGTGVRPGEDTNNSKYWAEQSKDHSDSASDSEDAAEAAQSAAEQAKESAVSASTTAVQKASEAAESAEKAEQYSGKPPIIQRGHWYTWDADSQEYQDTGEKALLNYDVTYASVEEMIADKDNQEKNTIAIISTDVSQEDNAKIYIRDDSVPNGWRYLADLSGFGGGGDMEKSVYDPQGKDTDIFDYVDQAVDGKQDKLTGNPGQLIGIGNDGTAEATVYPVNKDILINSYFVNPVNRNGSKTYSGSGSYSIDCWLLKFGGASLSIEEGYIVLSGTQVGAGIGQSIEISFADDTTLTLSVLYKGNVRLFANSLGQGAFPIFPTTENWSIASITFTAPAGTNLIDRPIHIGTNTVDETCIKAAKLELGSVQTLAHKEGNTWVLNEIPNFAEQYAICEQYDLATGNFIGSLRSNRNLFDNWYHIGGGSQNGNNLFPINQLGNIDYPIDNSDRQVFDRWYTTRCGCSILPNSINIKSNAVYSGGAGFSQRLDASTKQAIIGKVVTLSLLLSSDTASNSADETLYLVIGNAKGGSLLAYPQFKNETQLLTFTTTVPSTWLPTDIIWAGIGSNKVIFSLNIFAAKLELGSVQTLAHKEGNTWVLNDPPPDYGTELAKCQRYYWKSSGKLDTTDSAENATFIPGPGRACLIPLVNVPVTMRAVPKMKINGASQGEEIRLRATFNGKYTTMTIGNPGNLCLSREGLSFVPLAKAVEFEDSPYEATIELDANL